MDINEIIGKVRDCGMTNTEIASRSGLSRSYVSKFVNGRDLNPTVSTLSKILNASGVTLTAKASYETGFNKLAILQHVRVLEREFKNRMSVIESLLLKDQMRKNDEIKVSNDKAELKTIREEIESFCNGN